MAQKSNTFLWISAVILFFAINNQTYFTIGKINYLSVKSTYQQLTTDVNKYATHI